MTRSISYPLSWFMFPEDRRTLQITIRTNHQKMQYFTKHININCCGFMEDPYFQTHLCHAPKTHHCHSPLLDVDLISRTWGKMAAKWSATKKPGLSMARIRLNHPIVQWSHHFEVYYTYWFMLVPFWYHMHMIFFLKRHVYYCTKSYFHLLHTSLFFIYQFFPKKNKLPSRFSRFFDIPPGWDHQDPYLKSLWNRGIGVELITRLGESSQWMNPLAFGGNPRKKPPRFTPTGNSWLALLRGFY